MIHMDGVERNRFGNDRLSIFGTAGDIFAMGTAFELIGTPTDKFGENLTEGRASDMV